MPFEAYLLSLELIRTLREPLQEIRRSSSALAGQLERAAASIALNLAEGRRRSGRDQKHLYRVAGGSVEESRACLEVAESFGYLERSASALALRQLDSLAAITWTLTH